MAIKKYPPLLLLLLCDTLTFRQAYPTFRHVCRSNNSNNSDQKYQNQKIQNQKSKIPNSEINSSSRADVKCL